MSVIYHLFCSGDIHGLHPVVCMTVMALSDSTTLEETNSS